MKILEFERPLQTEDGERTFCIQKPGNWLSFGSVGNSNFIYLSVRT